MAEGWVATERLAHWNLPWLVLPSSVDKLLLSEEAVLKLEGVS